MSPATRRWLGELLADCDRSPRLSPWERQVTGDLACRLIERGEALDLSERQMTVLKRIEEKIHAAG